MLRTLLLLLFAVTLQAAVLRLYLKDGSYHLVREYKIEGNRLRYYSTERSDWEEIPLELADLVRTEAEQKEKLEARRREAAMDDAEEQAERQQRRLIESLPQTPGVYYFTPQGPQSVPQAEPKTVTNKRRAVLKAMTPIPILSGKATIEVDGLKAPVSFPDPRPELFIRLAAPERFGIARLRPTKTARIVQEWDVIPVTREIIEKTDLVDVFRQQLGEDLYKIWPQKPLEPGSYAVIEYTEGKGNLQLWPFDIVAPAR
jgi:hypothetical protein